MWNHTNVVKGHAKSVMAVTGISKPHFGRTFSADEDIPGKDNVAVIGYEPQAAA